MRHFVDDDNYDSMVEYESHVGLHYEPDEESHSILWREEYSNEYDDYGKSILNHD